MNKGFTLVELLAVLILMALLVVITIPGYTTVYSGVKRSNYHGKITEIESAALKYGAKIKDEIKDAGNTCITKSIADLIEMGYLVSEEDAEAVIHNPSNNSTMDGDIRMCYCQDKFDIEAYYYEEFNPNKIYYEDDYVLYNNILYRCKSTYEDKSGINGVDKKGNSYFERVSC